MAEDTKAKPVTFSQEDERVPVIVLNVKEATLDAALAFIQKSLKEAQKGTNPTTKEPWGGKTIAGRLKIYAE